MESNLQWRVHMSFFFATRDDHDVGPHHTFSPLSLSIGKTPNLASTRRSYCREKTTKRCYDTCYYYCSCFCVVCIIRIPFEQQQRTCQKEYKNDVRLLVVLDSILVVDCILSFDYTKATTITTTMTPTTYYWQRHKNKMIMNDYQRLLLVLFPSK